MTEPRRALLLSAYDTGSHRAWCRGLMALEGWDWTLLSLPARHFRWRIRGNPLSWTLRERAALEAPYDLIVATSTVDLAVLKGLYPALAQTPSIYYFHENQFAYPRSEGQHESIDPQMVNLYGAMAADAIVFNSRWNRQSFFDGLAALLNRLPDALGPGLLESLDAKTVLLPVPLDDDLRRATAVREMNNDLPPIVAWNHRVEYDKGPQELLALLDALSARGQTVRLRLLGQRYRKVPEAWHSIESRYASWIEHNRYEADEATYRTLLAESQIVLSTALHEFQGLAVMEAVALGCIPVVPERLSYPEFFPAECRYSTLEEACERIAHWRSLPLPSLSDLSWCALSPRYQSLFEEVVAGKFGKDG